MAGGIWGQTQDLDNRTLGPADLTQRRSDGRGGLGAQIWGQARNFTQIWGQTRDLDNRTLDPTGPDQSAGRTVPAVPVAQIWGQTRCPICRSGTFNVERSTLNF